MGSTLKWSLSGPSEVADPSRMLPDAVQHRPTLMCQARKFAASIVTYEVELEKPLALPECPLCTLQNSRIILSNSDLEICAWRACALHLASGPPLETLACAYW